MDKNIKELKESDLLKLRMSIDERLLSLEAEKAEKKRKKRDYALVEIVPDKIPRYRRMWDMVVNAVEAGEVVDEEKLNAITDKGYDLAHVDLKDIYPCPECEQKGTLYAGDYGDGHRHKYKVSCGSCSFMPKVRHEPSIYDAWGSFHKWLVSCDFLKDDTKFKW